MNETKEQLLLLKLRSLIADKEFITASANNELAWYEHWQCDWSIPMRGIQGQIDYIILEIGVICQQAVGE
jgi:hypothetical protein